MKKLTLVIRILVGLGMVFFGLTKFVPSLMMDLGEMPEAMNIWNAGAAASVYLMPLVGAIELVAGISLLINKFAPLMLIALIAVMINAFFVHLFMDPANIGGAAVFLLLTIFLMFQYKEAYKGLLKA
ncbi:MAG: DoxX family membrane protein [Flavobacteriales bacterium]|jgi:putative oxidoreductase